MKSSLFLLSSIGLMTAQAYANETASAVTLPTLNSSAQASLSLKTQVEQASSASKGMAQLKDIPQIVNVVPQQVLKRTECDLPARHIAECNRFKF